MRGKVKKAVRLGEAPASGTILLHILLTFGIHIKFTLKKICL